MARPYVNTFTMSETFTKPFNGILYNKEKIDDISRVVCPPYDVISNTAGYYERSSENAIRLELPEASGSMDQYANAKHIMDEWLKKDILLPDKEEAIYVYEQEFEIEHVSFLQKRFYRAS